MMATAHSRSKVSGIENTVRKGSAEEAARYLSVLIYRAGWRGDAVSALLRGDRLTYKGFEWWVD